MDKSTHDEVKRKTYEGSFWNFSDKDSTEIQREIRITRADLDETVEALQARLAPQEMVNHLMDMAHESLRTNAPRIAETVRRNPLPAALIGVGLGWLFYRSISPAPVRRGYVSGEGEYIGDYSGTETTDMTGAAIEKVKDWSGETASRIKHGASRIAGQARSKAGQVSSSAKDKASQWAEATKDKASQLADYTKSKAGQLADYTMEKTSDIAGYAKDKIGEAAHSAKEGIQSLGHGTKVQLQRAGEGTYETFRNNPLAFGLACLGLGAAVAMSLPVTRREEELMGEASDRLVSKAKVAGQETLEKVQNIAEAGSRAVQEEAQRQEAI